ncbi:MAG: DUF362 domain-containing protein [Bacillota bacterium]|nr:DUF362 domain-containing protein [Bacillota bacterium]MDW7683240.1 DUF362 domain-containing protein [Bacillota bacterium]
MSADNVSVVRYQDSFANIARAVQSIEGFTGLKPTDHVLLKPNLVMWDEVYPFPKYGVLTSSVLVAGIVRLLKEYGCSKITIGEGSITDSDLGSGTKEAFAGLGYKQLVKRYGVELVDFNDGPFERVYFDDYALDISSHALQTDFLVNLPVLKTHSSTKVSLGFKNLKGCLHTRSKMFCHSKDRSLDAFIWKLAEKIKPALTVIDGIYALEKGPVMNGRAYRTDLLIASRDMFAADVIGAEILGFAADDIAHLQAYAQKHGLSRGKIQTVGAEIADVTHPLEWDWAWLEDNSGPEAFARQGIKDIYFPKYDNTLCSGCSYLNNFMLVTLMGAYARRPFKGMEFLGGKDTFSRGGYDKTFLFGKCAIHQNAGNVAISEAVAIRGCPPGQKRILEVLREHGIPADTKAYAVYRASLYNRYEGNADFKEEHFQVL